MTNTNTNRRLIINIQRRGGANNDAQIERHVRRVASGMMSTRMLNTIRLTIKLRNSTFENAGARGECYWRDMARGGTSKSKHYTILVRRDLPLAKQLNVLTHEIRHVEQMATGRLSFRVTYGIPGYFWREVGQKGPATKHPIIDGECQTPYAAQPWEIEAREAVHAFPVRRIRRRYEC